MRLDGLLSTLSDRALARREAYDALDAAAGDGDFGDTFARGARALAERHEDLVARPLPDALRETAALLSDAMGGSSGAMWGVAFVRAAAVAAERGDGGPGGVVAMARAALEGVQDLGGAQVGDKTLVDALAPAVDAAARAAEAGEEGAQVARTAAGAAREGADGTRGLVARRGRAAYTGERSQGEPDAGAVAVAELLEAVAERWDAPPSWEDVRAAAARRGTGDDGGDAAGPVPASFHDHPDDVVDGALRGLGAAHPRLVRVVHAPRHVLRADAPVRGKVALVSGGGSGHEPMHAGFVGPGMLDAAVPGAVFTSASAQQVRAAARAVDGGAGVLLVVKNYTGDVAHFRLAAELLAGDGVRTETVLVADDVAVEDGEDGPGRRGTGMTPVVEKLCGARAEAGGTLEEVAALGRRVAGRGASFGVALSSVAPPGRPAVLDLPPGEMEVGVGIHGEAGRRREALRPASELVALMADAVLEALRPADGARLLALVNGFGGTSVLELHLLHGELDALLRARGLRVERALVGTYVSSVAMAGASVTLLELDDELLELWDAPVRTAALTWTGP